MSQASVSIPFQLAPIVTAFKFPLKGISQNWAQDAQPEGTTIDCLNVMPYDFGGRGRGGQRPGVSLAATNTFGSGGTGTTFMQYLGICNVIQTGTSGAASYSLKYNDGLGLPVPQDPTSPTYAQITTAIAGGNVYMGTIVSSLTLLSGTSGLSATKFIDAAVIDGRMFLTDGSATIKAVDLTTSPPAFTTYTAAAGGTQPPNPQYCTVYRKRLVVYGDGSAGGAAQNFYASRVGSPTDWNYGKNDPAAAWTAIASKTGQPGEPVNVLIPLGDDAMVIGCDRSIWLMNGDITDGGRIDVLTRGVGMTRAHCFDPSGNLYFVGSNGFYRIARGTFVIQDLSLDKYQQYFTAPPAGGLIAKTCVYDKQRHGIWIFTTNFNIGLSVHLFYDMRTEGFFPMQFPDTMGPARSILYDPQGIKASVLLGGASTNGTCQLFQVDNNSKGDNGGAITSYVWIGPLKPSGLSQNSIMLACDYVLGDLQSPYSAGDFNLQWTLNSGNSAYAAKTAPDISRTGTFTTFGRQTLQRNRMKGDQFMLKLSNSVSNKTWNLDEVAGHWLPGGPVRA